METNLETRPFQLKEHVTVVDFVRGRPLGCGRIEGVSYDVPPRYGVRFDANGKLAHNLTADLLRSGNE